MRIDGGVLRDEGNVQIEMLDSLQPTFLELGPDEELIKDSTEHLPLRKWAGFISFGSKLVEHG